MSRSRADSPSLPKVAVLGADAPIGADVRSALEAAGVPGSGVDLFGTQAAEPILSEYAGEARLIQRPDREALAAHAAVFVCEDGAEARGLVADGGGDRLVLDLAGISDAPPVGRGTAVPTVRGGAAVRLPHPLAFALAELLGPVSAAEGIASASVVVLRPAVDLGTAGVDELREQVTGLLSFGTVPTGAFGARLAFNCLPQAGAGERGASVQRRAEADLGHLLGPEAGPVGVRFAWVPVFHGHTVLIRLATRTGAPAGPVEAALRAATALDVVAGAADCTVEFAEGEKRIAVAPPEDDGAGGVWIWAMLEEIGPMVAARAVGLARAAGRV